MLAAVDLDDPRQVSRALFDLAWAAARDRAHPCKDLSAFQEALWDQVAAAFEWAPLPQPSGVDLIVGDEEHPRPSAAD